MAGPAVWRAAASSLACCFALVAGSSSAQYYIDPKSERNWKEDYAKGFKELRFGTTSKTAAVQSARRADITIALWRLGEHERALRASDATVAFLNDPSRSAHVDAWLKANAMRVRTLILTELSRYADARKVAIEARNWGNLSRDHRDLEEANNAARYVDVHEANNHAIDKALETGREAEQRGDFRGALAVYLQALAPIAGHPYLKIPELWNRAIDSALKLNPPPPIPEEARRHAVFGMTAMKQAKDPSGFWPARADFYSALKLAPWWPDVWINVAAAHEGIGQYRSAAQALQHYLRAAPNAPDRSAISAKSYEFEYLTRQYERTP